MTPTVQPSRPVRSAATREALHETSDACSCTVTACADCLACTAPVTIGGPLTARLAAIATERETRETVAALTIRAPRYSTACEPGCLACAAMFRPD